MLITETFVSPRKTRKYINDLALYFRQVFHCVLLPGFKNLFKL